MMLTINTDTPLLTARECDVLQYLTLGLPTKRIAAALGIGTETAKWHIKNVMGKLGGANRQHVVERALELGVVERADERAIFELEFPEAYAYWDSEDYLEPYKIAWRAFKAGARMTDRHGS